MSAKHFCDFCNKEITYENELPDVRKIITYTHEGKHESDDHDIRLQVMVSGVSGSPDGNFKKDICKFCLKELVRGL